MAGGALPPALLHTGHDAAPVRRAAACLLRDVVKHSVEVRSFVFYRNDIFVNVLLLTHLKRFSDSLLLLYFFVNILSRETYMYEDLGVMFYQDSQVALCFTRVRHSL